jgi:hypothetical protein
VLADKRDIKRPVFPQKRRLLSVSATERNAKRNVRTISATQGASDAREGTAGDTYVGSRWYRARLTCTTRAALCGRSPVRIRAVSRPYGPQTGRERNVCPGPSDGRGEPLMQHSCVRALLIVPLNVQAGTYPAASWTIGDRKQTTVWCAGSFAE